MAGVLSLIVLFSILVGLVVRLLTPSRCADLVTHIQGGRQPHADPQALERIADAVVWTHAGTGPVRPAARRESGRRRKRVRRVDWPAGDGAIVGVLAVYLLTGPTYIRIERRHAFGFNPGRR